MIERQKCEEELCRLQRSAKELRLSIRELAATLGYSSTFEYVVKAYLQSAVEAVSHAVDQVEFSIDEMNNPDLDQESTEFDGGNDTW